MSLSALPALSSFLHYPIHCVNVFWPSCLQLGNGVFLIVTVVHDVCRLSIHCVRYFPDYSLVPNAPKPFDCSFVPLLIAISELTQENAVPKCVGGLTHVWSRCLSFFLALSLSPRRASFVEVLLITTCDGRQKMASPRFDGSPEQSALDVHRCVLEIASHSVERGDSLSV